MYRKQELEAKAIEIVKGEKIKWELATAFITEKVSFNMRNLIRTLRKNYYGIFDQPTDPTTGLDKVWYPLTEINVEAVVKNIDLDTKDLNFRAKNKNGYAITDITRSEVKDELDKSGFGEKLDELERQLAIDGTHVWKTVEIDKKARIFKVDLLNVYIDPTSPSIQEAYRFTERSLMYPDEIKSMNGWMNTEDVVGIEGLARTDALYGARNVGTTSNIKMNDVYECWGKIPKSLITGLVDDDNEEVDGQIVVSGLDMGGQARCHLIAQNTKYDKNIGCFIKPYEECWYQKVPNRWYGKGIAEKVINLQIYANIVFNVRINRSRISQLGLFKIKKGAGITPQMLSRLQGNGAVVVNNMDDLQQLVVQEVGATSYKDEDVINQLSERLTNAFEVVTGEALPSSTPATNASIQNANARSGFTLIKETIGMFLARWMDRHYLPIFAKNLNKKQILRLSKNLDNYEELVQRVSYSLAMEALDKSFNDGYIPSDQEIQMAIQDTQGKLMKTDLFVNRIHDIIAEQLDTKFYVTNEELDVSVTVQNLVNMIRVAPQYAEAMVKQAFDLMGLGQYKLVAQPVPQGMPQGEQGAPQGKPMMSAQAMQSANTQAFTTPYGTR